MNLIPVVICGGSGSRLWPVSRRQAPKPFINLPSGQSLLAHTYQRVLALAGVEQLLTVTQRDLYFKTQDQLQALNVAGLRQHFLLEPCARNTAAAVAAAALSLAEREPGNTVLLIVPADHWIEQPALFAQQVLRAQAVAEAGWIVTFGVKAAYPETGYGYIELGQALAVAEAFAVRRFIEKPSAEQAQRYVEQGLLWNAGIVCSRLDTLLAELTEHAPALLQTVRESLSGRSMQDDLGQRCTDLEPHAFAQVEAISLDYALLERSQKVATVPCDMPWQDIGSWAALAQLSPADAEGNRLLGQAITVNASDNFVYNPERLTALVGVQDLLVVDTPDALLIAHREQAQAVKQVVQALEQVGHPSLELHRTVHRPWGTYTLLEQGPGFKVKRLVVNVGGQLSLQRHRYRSEHWVVIEGSARVEKDAEHFVLQANQSTFIPALQKHRLANAGNQPLVMIEVQAGSYVEEDDIERFDS